ncbi:MAG: DNA gyrase inhibitor YacG [Chromatiales bacterium]|nr:DNA gyrase inhibitor YacG [Chromatiales bacterium]
MTDKKPQVSCPTCKKPIVWDSSSPWRPFCSERCRLIDLGEWLEEGYKIPEQSDSGAPYLPPEHDQNQS